MRKSFLFLCLILFSVTVWAQKRPDTIVKRNGEKIEGHVRQLSQSEIFYGDSSMPGNVFRSISITDVAAILYGDGKVQTFELPAAAPPAQAIPPVPAAAPTYQNPAPALPQAKSSAELYALGYQDSQLYYTQYGGARVGTLLTTALLSPLWGLIPAIACSSTTPNTINMTPPPGPYLNEAGYVSGYKDGAKKKKSRKTWGGYGIGSAVWLGLIIVLSR